MRPFKFIFALIVCGSGTLAGIGCVSHAPEPLDPEVELQLLREAAPTPVTVEHAPLGNEAGRLSARFDPSDGLDEAEIVAVALSHNPDLKILRAKIGQTQAALISAGVWPNPEIGIGWRGGIDGAPGYTFDFDFLFELLRKGERQLQQQIAATCTDEARAELIAAEYEVAAQARRRWLAVLAAQQVAGLLDEEAKLRTAVTDLVQRKRELGEATELDVAAAALEAAEVRRDQRRAAAELEAAQRDLNRTLGLSPGRTLKLSASGQPIHVVVYNQPGDEELDRRILAGHQELAAKRAAYQRSEQELRRAVLQQYPKLKLGPSFGTEPEGTHYLGLGASLELPVFDRAQGQIAEALAARNTARGEFVATLHRLRAEAFDAREEMRKARAEIEAQEREVLPLVKRNEELFERAYRARELGMLDWVTARQRTLKARREYLDSVLRYRRNIIDLETATGMALAQPVTPEVSPSKGNATTQPATQRSP